MNNQDIHAMTGAYALDALDDIERARFEAHLDSCEDCRLEVEGLLETAALLAATTETDPPAALRDRILADVTTVRPLPPVVAPDGTDHRGDDTAPDRTVTPLRRRRWATLVAAAVALVAVGVGFSTTNPLDALRDDPGQESGPVASDEADRVLAADDAVRRELDLAEGSAHVVWSRSEGKAVLVTEDMPAPPRGRVYELWLQHPGGHMAPAGLMGSDSPDTVVLAGDATDAVGVGITVEPAGGSESPTTDPIAATTFEDA